MEPPQIPQVSSTTSIPTEFVTLKIVVPASSVCKTVRLSVKIKVKELHEIFSKKLSTLSNTPQHMYEDYGFYWHSDSGPVWLAEASALRAYNFRPNVTIEFKRRSASSPAKSQKSKGKKEATEVAQPTHTSAQTQQTHIQLQQPQLHAQIHAQILAQNQVQAAPQEPSLRKKMSAWVSSRPGSMYDQKKQKEKVAKSELKKERSQSVNLFPRKDPDAVVNASRFTSPSFSSTFETTPPASPRDVNAASLDDLDALIDGFDDLTDEPFNVDEFSDEKLLEEYAAGIEHEDLDEEEAEDRTSESPRHSYSSSPSPTESPPTNGRQRSYSSPRGTDRLSHYTSTAKYVHSTPTSPDGYLDTSGQEEDYTKMPGLRGTSGKRDPNPATNTVRVAAATSILEDALDGIETNTVDMDLMKHYITSALCILRTLH